MVAIVAREPAREPDKQAVIPKGAEDDAHVIQEPAKILRIGTMVRQLLDEVRHAPLDEAGRNRLREIHATSVRELSELFPEELREEFEELSIAPGDGIPSEAELRVAQAQLVGWLQGLFQGIQASFLAQQAETQSRLTQMRRGEEPERPAGREFPTYL